MNSRTPSSATHCGPSVNWKPSATNSTSPRSTNGSPDAAAPVDVGSLVADSPMVGVGSVGVVAASLLPPPPASGRRKGGPRRGAPDERGIGSPRVFVADIGPDEFRRIAPKWCPWVRLLLRALMSHPRSPPCAELPIFAGLPRRRGDRTASCDVRSRRTAGDAETREPMSRPSFSGRPAGFLQDAWWVRSSSAPWSHSLPTTWPRSSSSPAVITEADVQYRPDTQDGSGPRLSDDGLPARSVA